MNKEIRASRISEFKDRKIDFDNKENLGCLSIITRLKFIIYSHRIVSIK